MHRITPTNRGLVDYNALMNWSSLNWNAITAIATVISMFAFVATALYIRAELRAQEKDRFLNITNELFTVWQSREFMEAQLWLLHRLESTTWSEFVEAHRADFGEMAFHRVGSFYDRVGTLVRLGMVDGAEILSTIAPHAIGVWQKIEPLVREARRIENSVLFDDFERLLPACHECYVPKLGKGAKVRPFALIQAPERSVPERNAPERIAPEEVRAMVARGESVTPLDTRWPAQVAKQPAMPPGAVHISAEEVEQRLSELPKERTVIVYCACPNEETSIPVARLLQSHGYRARALTGGYAVLHAAGLTSGGPGGA